MRRPLKAKEGHEAVTGSVTVWRPWQRKQFELFQGVAISTPSLHQSTQEFLLACVQSGTAHVRYRNIPLSDPAFNGALYVIEPGETWTAQLKDVTYHHLFIDPAWLHQFAGEMLQREPSFPHFPCQPFFDPSLSRVMCELAASSQTPVSHLQQEERLVHLLIPMLLAHAEDAVGLPRTGWEHPAIKRTKEYLQAHSTEEVSLQDLAGVANLSPFHLAHVFRQEVGLPPHAYQTQLRLMRAKTLLAQGYDVGYVAQETGFCDQSHFTRQFKRSYLLLPGSYRKTARLF